MRKMYWIATVLTVALGVTLTAQPAKASSFTWATTVVSTSQGLDVSGNAVAADRSNTDNALGSDSAPAIGGFDCHHSTGRRWKMETGLCKFIQIAPARDHHPRQ